MSLFKDVNVVSIHVKDWEAAKKFYAKVLDWPVAWASDEMGWVEYGVDGATHISINRWDEDSPPPVNGPIPVLSVDDAHATEAALRALGVKCDAVIDIPGVVSYGTLYDPEGNRIQFAASIPPA
jgi:predicted enzyme related to lactoylglutathione lyase